MRHRIFPLMDREMAVRIEVLSHEIVAFIEEIGRVSDDKRVCG